MQTFTDVWNTLMSVATIGEIIICFVFLYTLSIPTDSFSPTVRKLVHKHILVIGFLISFAAMVGSLIYSNFIGYPPCLFCWYARIAFYPQVFLFGMALFKKDRKIIDYAIMLSVLGLVVGAYHSLIQYVGFSPLPCEAGGISCVTREVFQFGFITIPLMGAVGFLTLLLSLIIAKKAPE